MFSSPVAGRWSLALQNKTNEDLELDLELELDARVLGRRAPKTSGKTWEDVGAVAQNQLVFVCIK